MQFTNKYLVGSQERKDDCGSNCNGRGSCVEGKCVCKTGWTGPDCLNSELLIELLYAKHFYNSLSPTYSIEIGQRESCVCV